MTTRLARRFRALKQEGRQALVPFIMAGDPEPAVTLPLLHALAQAGADVLELGVPFSDPMADGPVIQRASERALKKNMTLPGVLALVKEFRARDQSTPLVLMGYLNPIEAMGVNEFALAALDAGVDGVLTVDLPPEEAQALVTALRARELNAIFLLAPTSGPERIKRIVQVASGFIYYVSLRGVTGASHIDVAEVAEKIKAIRRHTDLPLGVGFGINSPEAAAQVAQFADAVIIGSAIVKRMEALANEPAKILTEVPAFLAGIRAAMDQARTLPKAAGRPNR